jgi:hypothetical protein
MNTEAADEKVEDKVDEKMEGADDLEPEAAAVATESAGQEEV